MGTILIFLALYLVLIACLITPIIIISVKRKKAVFEDLPSDWTLYEPDSSFFDGKTHQYLGITILCFLMSFFSLGIAFPWAFCMKERWMAKHTVINGNRLTFVGKGSELILDHLIWSAITILTLGIFGIWYHWNLEKWRVSNLRYENAPDSTDSYFTGKAGAWFANHLVVVLLGIFSFGLALPWCHNNLMKWKASHTVISSSPLRFGGKATGLFGKYLVLVLLFPITLGIYGLFFPVSFLKWKFGRTESLNQTAEITAITCAHERNIQNDLNEFRLNESETELARANCGYNKEVSEEQMKKDAESGNPYAQYELARILKGDGDTYTGKALDLLRASSDAHYPPAMYEYAQNKKDPAVRESLLENSARLGHVPAQWALKELYEAKAYERFRLGQSASAQLKKATEREGFGSAPGQYEIMDVLYAKSKKQSSIYDRECIGYLKKAAYWNKIALAGTAQDDGSLDMEYDELLVRLSKWIAADYSTNYCSSSAATCASAILLAIALSLTPALFSCAAALFLPGSSYLTGNNSGGLTLITPFFIYTETPAEDTVTDFIGNVFYYPENEDVYLSVLDDQGNMMTEDTPIFNKSINVLTDGGNTRHYVFDEVVTLKNTTREAMKFSITVNLDDTDANYDELLAYYLEDNGEDTYSMFLEDMPNTYASDLKIEGYLLGGEERTLRIVLHSEEPSLESINAGLFVSASYVDLEQLMIGEWETATVSYDETEVNITGYYFSENGNCEVRPAAGLLYFDGTNPYEPDVYGWQVRKVGIGEIGRYYISENVIHMTVNDEMGTSQRNIKLKIVRIYDGEIILQEITEGNMGLQILYSDTSHVNREDTDAWFKALGLDLLNNN